MGENQEEVNVIWDTGSDWLTIESYLCTSCLGNTYDHSTETTFNPIADSDTTLSYGSATLNGYKAEDTVCFTAAVDTCVAAF